MQSDLCAPAYCMVIYKPALDFYLRCCTGHAGVLKSKYAAASD